MTDTKVPDKAKPINIPLSINSQSIQSKETEVKEELVPEIGQNSVERESINQKLVLIHRVLRDGGMDSQQQAKALLQIENIVWET
jgi:hypothetical protein